MRETIREISECSDRTYGAMRVTEELQDCGMIHRTPLGGLAFSDFNELRITIVEARRVGSSYEKESAFIVYHPARTSLKADAVS
jgi:hypothetical protein